MRTKQQQHICLSPSVCLFLFVSLHPFVSIHLHLSVCLCVGPVWLWKTQPLTQFLWTQYMSWVSLTTCLSWPLLREALGIIMWVTMADVMTIIHPRTLCELIQAVLQDRCSVLPLQGVFQQVLCLLSDVRYTWRMRAQLLYILLRVACFSNVSWWLTVVSLRLTLRLLAVSNIITGARCSPHFVLVVWGRKVWKALRGFCAVHHNKPAHCTSSVASTEPPLSYRYHGCNATITLLWQST